MFALFSGFVLSKIIRTLKFDRKLAVLRFPNRWHYILSGECLDFPNVKGKASKVDGVILEVLAEIKNENPILYRGHYMDVSLHKDGSLESMLLSNPVRVNYRDYNRDKVQKMGSRYIVIPLVDIINVNYSYLNIKMQEMTWGQKIINGFSEIGTQLKKLVNKTKKEGATAFEVTADLNKAPEPEKTSILKDPSI